MRWLLSNVLLYTGNLIAIFGSLFGLITGRSAIIFIIPSSGYTGLTKFYLWGIHPDVFLITAIASSLALVGVFMASKKRSARVLMGIGSLLVLSHSIIGLFGYYEIITSPLLESGLSWYQPTPIVFTGFFGMTLFGLVALITGLSMYSDRIMAFVNTRIR
jgi:hypothetical protein